MLARSRSLAEASSRRQPSSATFRAAQTPAGAEAEVQHIQCLAGPIVRFSATAAHSARQVSSGSIPRFEMATKRGPSGGPFTKESIDEQSRHEGKSAGRRST